MKYKDYVRFTLFVILPIFVCATLGGLLISFLMCFLSEWMLIILIFILSFIIVYPILKYIDWYAGKTSNIKKTSNKWNRW